VLKHLVLNKKRIPVPVPITTLENAISWVETTLLSGQQSITKIILDEEPIPFDEDRYLPKKDLHNDSKLFVQIDSPKELSLQTIDALKNLTSMIEKSLEALAVNSWQTTGRFVPKGYSDFKIDYQLIIELTDHLLMMLDAQVYSKNVVDLVEKFEEIRTALSKAETDLDWKSLARILLTQLAPKLEEYYNELNSLEKALFELQANGAHRS
jgi:hypothetical protein